MISFMKKLTGRAAKCIPGERRCLVRVGLVLKREYEGQRCSVAKALEVVGERWTILIVRDAWLGITRFDGFLGSLGIARNVLAKRLNHLVQHGILERVPYQQRPVRYEYRLTVKGRDLSSALLSLMQWGDRYLADEQGPPRRSEHLGCGGRVSVQLWCEACQRPVSHADLATPPAGE